MFSFLVDLNGADGPLPGVQVSGVMELGALPLDYAQVRFHRVRLPFERWLRDSARIDGDGRFHDPLGSPDLRLRRTLCVGQALWGRCPPPPRRCRGSPRCWRCAMPGGAAPRDGWRRGPLLRYRTQQRAYSPRSPTRSR
ncbi:hypothetical protein GXW82_04200 [Streptacidiphilus sp. 4-A2]|nr:hypothetical protein [Streptacidiphilus sp. 4-A2]